MAQTAVKKPKKLIQFQRPMAAVLTALVPATLMGIYNFGWRVLATIALANACCFLGEYLFVRREGKPVTLAAFVTGTLFALVLPPNVPFWLIALGALFAIVFGKMVFGGFGKNIFNPAMTGRCLLYILAPLYLSGTWSGPVENDGERSFAGPAGFARWTVSVERDPVAEVSLPARAPEIDGVTGATTLTAVKTLAVRTASAERALAEARAEGEGVEEARSRYEALHDAAAGAVGEISLWRLFKGRISGSQGETSALAILLGMVYLLYRKAAKKELILAPVAGVLLGMGALTLLGAIDLPFWKLFAINLLGGGALFGYVFMTTEPVSAPTDVRARWVYGILIGVLMVVIRTQSVFNAGLMFSILLGNMFAPILDIVFGSWDGWRKHRIKVKAGIADAPAGGGTDA